MFIHKMQPFCTHSYYAVYHKVSLGGLYYNDRIPI